MAHTHAAQRNMRAAQRNMRAAQRNMRAAQRNMRAPLDAGIADLRRTLEACLVLACAVAAGLALACVASVASAASADGLLHQELVPRFSGPEVVEKLKAGGNVVLMRHMATVREPDRWSGVEIEDCSTQRELSDLGRHQAQQIGEAFRKLGIPVGKVLVSPYCRTRETAELAFGKSGIETELLSTWDQLSVDEKTERATELRKLLDTPPDPGTNTVLITHTGNLLWSFGLDSKPEGLAHVFEPTGLSIARPTYLGRVDPDEWRALAGLPDDAGTAGDAAAASPDDPTATPAGE